MTLKVAIASFAHVHAGSYAHLLASLPGIDVLSADPDVTTTASGPQANSSSYEST